MNTLADVTQHLTDMHVSDSDGVSEHVPIHAIMDASGSMVGVFTNIQDEIIGDRLDAFKNNAIKSGITRQVLEDLIVGSAYVDEELDDYENVDEEGDALSGLDMNASLRDTIQSINEEYARELGYNVCGNCSAAGATLCCESCGSVYYCSQKCMHEDADEHIDECEEINNEYEDGTQRSLYELLGDDFEDVDIVEGNFGDTDHIDIEKTTDDKSFNIELPFRRGGGRGGGGRGGRGGSGGGGRGGRGGSGGRRMGGMRGGRGGGGGGGRVIRFGSPGRARPGRTIFRPRPVSRVRPFSPLVVRPAAPRPIVRRPRPRPGMPGPRRRFGRGPSRFPRRRMPRRRFRRRRRNRIFNRLRNRVRDLRRRRGLRRFLWWMRTVPQFGIHPLAGGQWWLYPPTYSVPPGLTGVQLLWWLLANYPLWFEYGWTYDPWRSVWISSYSGGRRRYFSA